VNFPQLCASFIAPSGPANFRGAVVQKTSALICWNPPANRGCVDRYELDVRLLEAPPGELRAAAPFELLRFQEAECYRVGGLREGAPYEAVRAVTDRFGS
jgi:hypothetical protein